MNKFFIAIFVFCCQHCSATYYSQIGQDQYINEQLFGNYQGGVFVDIGAHNGVTYSNTYFLEKERGWTGICIEPIPARFEELKACRNCVCVQGCVSDINGISQLLMVSSPVVHTEMLTGLLHTYDPRHLERMKIELFYNGGSYDTIDVQCYKLNDLLEQNGITHVNYLSIDTEGGEFDILASIDFSKFKIDAITVEDNYGDPRFIPFLEEKGFNFVTRLEWDLLFVHKDFQLD
jgi:FkbM family methyltransferase